MSTPRNPAAACNPATLATMTFEPVALDLTEVLPSRAQFVEHAGNAFACIAIGTAMLTKDPAELAAVLKTLGEDGIISTLDELAGTRKWLAGYVQLLDAVEARALIAASRVAVET